MAAKSLRPLDPMAAPYHRILPPHIYVTKLRHSPPYYHFWPPFHSYNVHHHHQQWPLKSFPVPLTLPPPPSATSRGRKNSSLITPVPSGPRVLKSRLPARVKKLVRDGDCDVKSPAPVVGKRWKNRHGSYHRNLPLESETTTVMIKNIPNKYSRNLIIQTLDHHCKLENDKIKNGDKGFISAYDLVYLPIDFKRRSNAGFAFVNFTSSQAALRFAEAFHGKTWAYFGSSKVACISRARIQGKQALINNFRIMNFSYGSEEDMPVWFEPPRNGSDRVTHKMFTVGKFFY